jgi:transcriptional regulator with XRE-family HTH domain
MPEVASPTAAELGQRLRARREELGLSLEQLAAKTDTHWSWLGRAERGTLNLTFVSVVRLADGLGIDVGDLVRGIRVAKAPAREGRGKARP